ncbi:unnamed protein product [Cochlearia groenlandica]
MVSSRESGKKQTQDVLDSHSSREEHKEEEEEEEDWITQLRLQLSDDDDEQPSAAKVSEQDVKSSRESKQEDTLDNTRVDKKVKSKDDKQKHCCTKRNNAVSVALTPNPKVFKRKIDTSEVEEGGEILIPEKHNKGCRCRKTGCTHPLCLCYRANKPCSETCRCQDCKNTGERNAIQHRQKANKACKCQKSGCRQPPCICRRENRKCSEICKCKDCDNGREINNTIQRTQQATNEAIRSALGITKAIPASTTFTNRPRMSGIIEPKICSVMATKSMDAAAKKRSDKRQKHDKDTSLDKPQRDANEFNDSSECVPGHADRVDKKPRSPAKTNTSPSRQEPDDEEQTH